MTVDELVKLSGSNARDVRRAMDLWLDERVLREVAKEGQELRYEVVADPTAEEVNESAGGGTVKFTTNLVVAGAS